MYKVKDHPNLIRDPFSNAVLVKKDSSYEAYLKRRDADRKLKDDVNNLKIQNENLEKKLDVILDLLKERRDAK